VCPSPGRSLFSTSGFWPRVRAHALRAPVFLSSLPPQTGRCTTPRLSQLRCYLIRPSKYIKSIGPPTSRAFSFPLDHNRGYEILSTLPPAPPIAASLILSTIFWGQNVQGTTISSNFFWLCLFVLLLDLFFLLFPSFPSFLFTFFLFISSYPSLLTSSYSSRRKYSSSSYSSLLIF
jgi:hypothetical protein